MQSFEITQRKEFMAKLLKSDLFHAFEVREVIAHVSFKIILDGKRNQAYFHNIDEEVNSSLSEYLSWEDLRIHVYDLMSGKKLPTYFKIILSMPQSKTQLVAPDITGFFLNITFKDNQITCTTGTSYNTFTLDKSAENKWDEDMKRFLLKHEFM